MNKYFSCSLLAAFTFAYGSSYAESTPQKVAPAPNGIEFQSGYSDWRSIGVSHRTDNDSMRMILGNDIAVKAARSGKTQPWPEGAVLAKVVWNQRTDENWPAAIVPGEFWQVEFMIKNSKKYAATQGWGFARWRGKDLKPWGETAEFDQQCIACHTPVADRDYVFTTPAAFSDRPAR